MTTHSTYAGSGQPNRRSPRRTIVRSKNTAHQRKISKVLGERARHRSENEPLQHVRKLRIRLQLNQLDYDRALTQLKTQGHTQEQLAQALVISQPSVSSALKTAAKTPVPREGFSGADPYEVCQRYAAGELTRNGLIHELTQWDYETTDGQQVDFFDDLKFSAPGSFDDVVRALDEGLIEDDVYDVVLDALSDKL